MNIFSPPLFCSDLVSHKTVYSLISSFLSISLLLWDVLICSQHDICKPPLPKHFDRLVTFEMYVVAIAEDRRRINASFCEFYHAIPLNMIAKCDVLGFSIW
jgi:hypothetical protein